MNVMLAFVTLNLMFGVYRAIIIDGVSHAPNSWEYITRFCFSATPTYSETRDPTNYGRINYDVTVREGDKLSLFVYFEGWEVWRDVYGSAKTCSELSQLATKTFDLWDDDNDSPSYSVKGSLPVAPVKSSFIFVAIANCQLDEKECTGRMCQGSLNTEWSIEFLNGGSARDQHFSCEEKGLFETDITFFAFQAILCMFAIVLRRSMKRKRKYHHTVRMLVHSVFFQILADIGSMMYWAELSRTGEKYKGWKIMGEVANLIANSLIVLMLVLVAKGWTIVRRKISAKGRVTVTVFMTLYVWFSAVNVYWEYELFDGAEAVYKYDRPAGISLLVMRGLMCLWFWIEAANTLARYRSKRRFYEKFIWYYSSWLVSLPIFVAIASDLDDWVRPKVVHSLARTAFFAAQLSLLLLYNPSKRYNRTFPFHSNTSVDLGITKPNTSPAESLQNLAAEEDSKAVVLGSSSSSSTAAAVGTLSGLALSRVTNMSRNMKDRMGTLQQYTDELQTALEDVSSLEVDGYEELPETSRNYGGYTGGLGYEGLGRNQSLVGRRLEDIADTRSRGDSRAGLEQYEDRFEDFADRPADMRGGRGYDSPSEGVGKSGRRGSRSHRSGGRDAFSVLD